MLKMLTFCEIFVSCSYGWYFTFIQGWVYIALIYLQGFTTKQMVNPWKTYVKLSAVLMGSHGLTKGSLAFLNYPAQLMFKSTKVKSWFHSCIVWFYILHLNFLRALSRCTRISKVWIYFWQVLPVMVMGAFIPGLRRKYPPHEYVSALLLVIGLILFTLADANTSPNFSILGVVMVSGALIMDSFLGNFQEAIFKMNPDTTQVTLHVTWSISCCRKSN